MTSITPMLEAMNELCTHILIKVTEKAGASTANGQVQSVFRCITGSD